MLSNRERETLREVERRLLIEDPEFSRSFKACAQRLPHPGGVGIKIFLVAGLLLSALVLVTGSLGGAPRPGSSGWRGGGQAGWVSSPRDGRGVALAAVTEKVGRVIVEIQSGRTSRTGEEHKDDHHHADRGRAAAALALVGSSLRVVTQYEPGVVFRFGRILPETRGPGLAMIAPVGDRL